MIRFWTNADLVADRHLTGRVRYRLGWFGRFVLQVEEELSIGAARWSGSPVRWRDARPKDFEFMRWSREIGVADS